MRLDPSLIIKTLQNNNGMVRLTARELQISPGTVINWRRRSHSPSQGGRYVETSLARHSTKPKTSRITSLSARQQDEITSLRKQYQYGASILVKMVNVDKHLITYIDF